MFLKRYHLKNLVKEEISKLQAGRFSQSSNRSEKMEGVRQIIEEVKLRGDQALIQFSKKWDGIDLDKLYLEENELNEISQGLGQKEKDAIKLAYSNIFTFHKEQITPAKRIETMPGVLCWKEQRAISRVGLYIPGGTAPLFSTFLMLGIPAQIAGVSEIIICSPVQKNGPKVHPALAFIAVLLNIKRIYLVGGAQAIAAMAYGTETLPKVDKIFGPGNTYVTLAKQIISTESQTSIDMPAGPSEVLIISDESSHPDFIASDLLAQAEHGIDSQVVLVCTREEILNEVEIALDKQLKTLSRSEIAREALKNSFSLLVENMDQAFEFSNDYAPEHLILSFDHFEPYIERVKTAGSVFLGSYSPEAAGDYASGTNHTLPTSGYAKMYSGVSVDSFMKSISFQNLSPAGLESLGPSVETLAGMEGLDAHAQSIRIRLNSL